MTNDFKELLLNEKYNFEVTIETEQGTFAGDLVLTPEKIALKIMGENSGGRRYHNFQDAKQIICKGRNCTFVLMGLMFVRGGWRLIDPNPSSISYFESNFEVDNLIYCPQYLSNETSFTRFEIYSKTIMEWIGNTQKQSDIIHKYNNDKSTFFKDNDFLEEFFLKIENLGAIGVLYRAVMHHSLTDFRAGILFPPTFYVSFESGKPQEETVSIYKQVYNLLSFITGDELEVEKVILAYEKTGLNISNVASMYYPSQKQPKRSRESCVLFPLGKNLKYEMQGLPELPLEIFQTYFKFDNIYKGYFEKYIRYRRMENVEERFLGYFRILETLCHVKKNYLDEKLLKEIAKKAEPYLIKKFADTKSVKSFIKSLPKHNANKYNTDKCFQDFYESLNFEECKKMWKYDKSEFVNICKLRNDMIHANNIDLLEEKIEEYAKFIEILLVVALFKKLDITDDVLENIIHRCKHYFLIMK